MTTFRRLAWLTLALAFGQVVFGAIVRITGSGMGCGDHWPQCAGYWIPPLERPDLIIEVTHRYIAATLTLAIVALASIALVRRRQPGVAGAGGVLRPTLLAATLVVVAALFGAATVKYELANKAVIVTHLAIAMSLLAVLLIVIERSRSSNVPTPNVSPRTVRGAMVAAGLVFVALVFGALTAHLPGANTACLGFPLCSGSLVPTAPVQHVQYVHRVVAFLLLLHTAALTVGISRRQETAVLLLARLTLLGVLAQVVLAAFLVTRNLPVVLRSLHEAVGTLIWLLAVGLLLVARRNALTRAAKRVPSMMAAEAQA